MATNRMGPRRTNSRFGAWGDFEFSFGDRSFVEFTDINYGQSAPTEPVYGANRSGRPLGYTGRTYECEDLTMTVYEGGFYSIIEYLQDLVGPGKGYAEATIPVCTLVEHDDEDIHIVEFHGVKLINEGNGFSQGSDALTTDLTFKVEYIVKDGKRMTQDD